MQSAIPARKADGVRKHGREGFRAIVFKAVAFVARSIERSRQRRALIDLGDDMLKDIGITRSEADRESRMPFWR
ncbi:MAG TPA: DUF1127 domain-containing protein [Hypericibacter adhaerens]|jgi:uncharacterized protein YjiS (DUF1127 family)|uniref:YjiS-like domain-containing protein n=1 Tax=Hypericibacter adhaerens TaxID=2602016 RepID=A0A5J6N157_9PROT|nr:DUF1127 domain-containing protein [Hypericibacter adhaerens]QEX20636.1 hypothetical protein FRZ61_05540 [Hypericibacter adhaerens]HWA45105.1 DUF1127 domain-containing protein [Hypericibacter adhaerens]